MALQERRTAGAVRAACRDSCQSSSCGARQVADSRAAAIAEGFSAVEKAVAADAAQRSAAAVASIAFTPRQWVRQCGYNSGKLTNLVINIGKMGWRARHCCWTRPRHGAQLKSSSHQGHNSHIKG